MLPDIKKILYATDLSESARYAFGYAASLADCYGEKWSSCTLSRTFLPV